MKKLADIAEADRLIQARFRPGVQTNHFLPPGELPAEIAAGDLLAEAWEGGLALFHRREGYWRLTYYLNDLTAPYPGAFPPGPVATEIAWKSGADRAATAYWQAAGFTLEGGRVRMRRRREDPFLPVTWPIRRSGEADREAIRALLAEHFHPYLGCIPTAAQLTRLAAEGRFLIADDGFGGVGGILCMATDGRRVLLRHLAVRPELRGKQVGYALMAAGLREETRETALFWTAGGDTPARRLYDRLLAVPDGWQSDLLLYVPKT